MTNGVSQTPSPAPDPQRRRWLNLEQLLSVLPLKKSRIYYLVHTNQIPYQHIGRTLIFDYDEIASWSVVRGRKGRMGQDIAYLVKRNGVYAAKFQKPSGSWTHHSLHTERAAEAKLLFDQFRFDLLQKKELDLNRIVSVRLGELALLHLADVEQNQARSWHLKQRNYLNHHILPFFGAKRMSTDISARLIEEYVTSRRKTGMKATTANKELSCIKACSGSPSGGAMC